MMTLMMVGPGWAAAGWLELELRFVVERMLNVGLWWTRNVTQLCLQLMRKNMVFYKKKNNFQFTRNNSSSSSII